MMKAMVIDGFGSAARLHTVDLPVPKPAADEVLIRVVCAGVNPVDWKIREGLLDEMFPHRFPLIPGWEAAGVVAAVGTGVRDVKVGDAVYTYLRKMLVQWGAYAEYVTMAAEAVAPKPATASFAEAAGVPLAGLTAWQSLFDAGRLNAGQSVLVHAAAGGTGGFAVQFAKNAGATVLATASAANHDYVRSLGADHVIDYTRDDFVHRVKEITGDGVDLAFVTVGGDVLHNSYRAVKAKGAVVSIVDAPAPEAGDRYDLHVSFVFVEANGGQLREIAALIDGGRVRPLPVRELALEEAAAAQEMSRAGHVRGKLVLRVSSDPD
jgi:NADPH2:quinone reductase